MSNATSWNSSRWLHSLLSPVQYDRPGSPSPGSELPFVWTNRGRHTVRA